MTQSVRDFQHDILTHYREHGRIFPWRETTDPYAILVSEIMLQQTQTERVVPKYQAFLQAFPTLQALAAAEPTEVLRYWQGLGYNRRGLALQRAAQAVVQEYKGEMPRTMEQLQTLPGIGPYTAGAVCAFAFNEPVVMIETNIRRVYIHHFFADHEEVSDKQLMPLIKETLDTEQPRVWYYALMDYGSWLGKKVPNPNRRSKHYTKQSTFTGSNRQLRGAIMRVTLERPTIALDELILVTNSSPQRVQECLTQLAREGFPLPTHLV